MHSQQACTSRAQGKAQSTAGSSGLLPSFLRLPSKKEVTRKLKDQAPRTSVCGMGGCVFHLLLRMSSSFLPFVVVVHLTKIEDSEFL